MFWNQDRSVATFKANPWVVTLRLTFTPIAAIFFVYIMTNPRKTVLYTGVTNNLPRRVHEHKEKLTPGFASKYNVTDLIYYEMAETAEAAITREKQLKAGSRQRKIELIKSMNPTWRDLSVGYNQAFDKLAESLRS